MGGGGQGGGDGGGGWRCCSDSRGAPRGAGPLPPPPGSLFGTSCLELSLGCLFSVVSVSDCLTLQEPSWLSLPVAVWIAAPEC